MPEVVMAPRCVWLIPVLSVSCTGRITTPPAQKPDGPQMTSPALEAWATGARRLSRLEYDNSLRDLLGDTTRSGFTSLPEDSYTPFDNDFTTQQASAPLIESAE